MSNTNLSDVRMAAQDIREPMLTLLHTLLNSSMNKEIVRFGIPRGTGNTTLGCDIAVRLAALGHRVLFIASSDTAAKWAKDLIMPQSHRAGGLYGDATLQRVKVLPFFPSDVTLYRGLKYDVVICDSVPATYVKHLNLVHDAKLYLEIGGV